MKDLEIDPKINSKSYCEPLSGGLGKGVMTPASVQPGFSVEAGEDVC